MLVDGTEVKGIPVLSVGDYQDLPLVRTHDNPRPWSWL